MKQLMSALNISIIFTLFASYNGYSQFECRIEDNFEKRWGSVWDCNPNTQGNFSFFSNLDNYIPYFNSNPLQNPPLKTIRLNFNIFLKSDSTGNYPNNQATRDTLREIINIVNRIYSVKPPSNPILGIQEIDHSYIQFEIGEIGNERIYFYNDDLLYQQTTNTALL
jgi:hypothetical protein